jgi:hypothetical protein
MTLEERVPERVPKMRNTCNLPFMVLGGPTFASAPYCGQHLERSQRIGPWGAHMVELVVALQSSSRSA